MTATHSGKDKIRQICEILRKETLDPATEDAKRLVEEAKQEADRIIAKAKEEQQRLIDEAKAAIEKQRSVFEGSLAQACKQAVEHLRQEIEKHLFNAHLEKLIAKGSSDPQVVASLINAIVQAINKEGLRTDLTAVIPESVSKEAVNSLLLAEVVKQLTDGGVAVGNFKGGAQVRLHGKNLTLDLSDDTLREMVAEYLRKDFRMFLFEINE
jgi:V/A-type H+-transporting ATPase subunit E